MRCRPDVAILNNDKCKIKINTAHDFGRWLYFSGRVLIVVRVTVENRYFYLFFRLSVVTSLRDVRSATVSTLSAQFGGTSYFMHGLLLHKPKFVNEGDICTYVKFQ